MAKTQIFSDPADSNWGMLATPTTEAVVRCGELRPGGRLRVNACWLLVAQPGGYENILDQSHGRMLHFDPNGNITTIDVDEKAARTQAIQEECLFRVEWDAATGDLGYITPKKDSTRAIKRGARGAPLGLGSRRDAACRWKLDFAPVSASEPIPTNDGNEIDENFYNIKAAYASGSGNECYLTILNEQEHGSPVLFGRRGDISNAQFRLVPAPSGVRAASDRSVIADGDDEKARLITIRQEGKVSAPETKLINLNGSRRFRTGDRVAFHTPHQRYIGTAATGNDLIAKGWKPDASTTFILERVSGTGPVATAERFTLKASDGRYLREDRDHVIRAAGANVADGNTAFILDAPPAATFALIGRNSGHPLMLETTRQGVRRLVQRFASGPEAPILFQLRRHEDAATVFSLWTSEGGIIPMAKEGVDVVDPARLDRNPGLGAVSPGFNDFGTAFVLQKAPVLAWPNTPDLTMESYRDPAENYMRMLAGGVASMAGAGSSALLEIPGGAAVFSFAFNMIWPEKTLSTYDLFSRFRADLLNDVKRLFAANSVFQSQGALKKAHDYYLIDYLNSRRAHISGEDLAETRNVANVAASMFNQITNFLALERSGTAIVDSQQNAELVAAGLPLYVLCALEYVNVLQELALLHAYRPGTALPDVYLRPSNDDYVVADPKTGVHSLSTQTPLTQAVRVLSRNGDRTLHHGDKVILRAPAGTNVSALNGGGGALQAIVNHIGDWEIFTLEKVAATAVPAGTAVADGDAVALRPHNKGFYLSAGQSEGRPVTAGAPHRAAWETFKIEISSGDYVTSAKKSAREIELEAGAKPPYEQHIDNLRQHARSEYRAIQEMYAFLVSDRQKRFVYLDKHHESSMDYVTGSQFPGLNNKYTLSFRDKLYNWNIDRVKREWGSKPAGWDSPENHGPLQQAMDQYRQHLAHTYFNFKYRYFEAAQRLETIADDTDAICKRMWADPLLATAFSYEARTTPRHQA